MTSDLINNEMRLAAIEYLLCELWVNSMKFAGITEQEFAWRTDAMLANLQKQTLPGFKLPQTNLRKLLDILSIYNERCWDFKKCQGHDAGSPRFY
jgi:hypothetical protein